MIRQLVDKKFYVWLPGYLINRLSQRRIMRPQRELTHIMFLVVDHFEPCRKQGILGVRKVREWCEKYASVAALHKDSDNVYPQHTWFYRYDYPNYDCIDILNEHVYEQFGEIEFHLHHGYDTPQSFTQKIRDGLRWFNRAGAMLSAIDTPQAHFAYIAGNWALDNGRRDPEYSGVNNELEILSDAGCYADYTFPAIGTNAQPCKVNSIYYAKDDPDPKSYARGRDVRVGKQPSGDLMIFQGPVFMNLKKKYIESAALESFAPYNPRRLDSWIKANIHVLGRNDWIFVKLHTHGIQSMDFVLGDHLNNMLTDLEGRFNQHPFQLHYVNAREAFNIVKAAEAGESGNPNDFRDFMISPPANKKIFCNSLYKLERYSDRHLVIHIDGVTNDTIIKFKGLPINEIRGQEVRKIDMIYENSTIKRLRINGDGRCSVGFRQRGEAKSRDLYKTFDMPVTVNEYELYFHH